MTPPLPKEKVGLIAGNGRFPFLFLNEAKKAGADVVVVALKEETDPSLAQEGVVLHWINLGQLGRLIAVFKEAGISRAVMAGQVKHTQLFSGIVPDLRALKILKNVLNKKADSLLSAVSDELAQEGIILLPSTTYLSHLLAQEGILTQHQPTPEEEKDIAFGVSVAKKVAGQDIGQTVTVKDQAIVAVEAMEGTDACILRSSSLVKAERFTVVKVAKPGQDMRFDVPVVGPGTITTMVQAGAGVLAVEARRTLLIDQKELLALADRHRIVVAAYRGDECA